jgi:hypothetical protein
MLSLPPGYMTFDAAHWRWGVALIFFGTALHAQTKRQLLTIDDLFSYTEIRSAKLAPGGSAAVIATSRRIGSTIASVMISGSGEKLKVR